MSCFEQVDWTRVRLPSPPQTSRGRAVVARWAHNPKVAGSNPAPATKESW